MEFLEKDLESIIWESDNEKLQEKGLDIYGKKFRQLRIGNYGIADLVTIEKNYFEIEKTYPFLNITVFELKKEKAGISAFFQAVRYCKGIQTYLESRKIFQFKLNIVLCSKKIDTESDYIFLCDLINSSTFGQGKIHSLTNYSFKFTIDGIEFKDEYGYNLTNKGF